MSNHSLDKYTIRIEHYSSQIAANLAAYLRLRMRRSLTYAFIGLALMSRRVGKTGYEAGKINEVRDA